MFKKYRNTLSNWTEISCFVIPEVITVDATRPQTTVDCTYMYKQVRVGNDMHSVIGQ